MDMPVKVLVRYVHQSSCLPTFCFICQEAINFGDGTIEGDDFEAMVGSIHDQVLAHDGQTNKAKITTGIGTRG
jgi:hypothetical protein